MLMVSVNGCPPCWQSSHQQCTEWAWGTEWGSAKRQPIFLVNTEAQCQGCVWEPVQPTAEGFHPFCSWALGRWVFFPAPAQVLLPQSLRFTREDIDDTATIVLAAARAVLCSPLETWEALGCSFAPRDQHRPYTCARGSHAAVPAVQCACNATQGRSSPRCSPSAAQECYAAI